MAVLRARNATRPSDEIDDMESVLESYSELFESTTRQERHRAQVEEFGQRIGALKAEGEAAAHATGLLSADFKSRAYALAKEIHTLRNEQRVRLGGPEIDFETDWPGAGDLFR